MQYKSLAYLASIITIALGSTVQNVLTDLANLKTSVTTLDNSINAFPQTNGTLAEALAIHSNAQSTEGVINTATTDAQNVSPSPVDETDGQSVLAAVNGIVPIIENALTVIVERKPQFESLPVGGIPALVLQDLQGLSNATQALEIALTNAAPSDLVAQANAISSEINSAFATAIAAYS